MSAELKCRNSIYSDIIYLYKQKLVLQGALKKTNWFMNGLENTVKETGLCLVGNRCHPRFMHHKLFGSSGYISRTCKKRSKDKKHSMNRLIPAQVDNPPDWTVYCSELTRSQHRELEAEWNPPDIQIEDLELHVVRI